MKVIVEKVELKVMDSSDGYEGIPDRMWPVELPDGAKIVGVTADFEPDIGEGYRLWYTVPVPD